ncbi:hypothetical protein HY642_00380 [Candidatus Woesearchaeota archaeon]|nr:hypothetical protein [Candidatus Woesearchaeota archaeon]
MVEKEEYELVSRKEIENLKREVDLLKQFPVPPSKRLQATMDDLASKLDRLTVIFERASHDLRLEEGGMTFQDRMKPLVEKIETLASQNADLAQSIVVLNDVLNSIKTRLEKGFVIKEPEEEFASPLPETSPMPPPELPSYGTEYTPTPRPGMPPPPPAPPGLL